MKKLIEALTIFSKYADVDYPTHCEHDMLMVMDVAQESVSDTDVATLDKLGFFWNEEYDSWCSYRYGSA